MRTLLHEARRGDTIAMRQLARILWDGTSSAGTDRKTAIAWWVKAAHAGDTKAMVILGDMYAKGIYVAQDTAKAQEYYKKAELKGSQAARKRLLATQPQNSNDAPANELDAEEPETSDVTVTAPPATPDSAPPSSPSPAAIQAPKLHEALSAISKDIISAATQNGVQDIAVVRFQSNGGTGSSLSDNVQSLVIEEMLNSSADIAISDRTNERYIEVESSLDGTAGEISSANAMLVGEVFFSPGDSVGICTVRLFRISDCRILFAGCSHVSWSDAETMQMGSTSRTRHSQSFARMDESSIRKLEAEAPGITTGFAFVQNGTQSSDHTLNLRVACAQILSTLVNKGAAAYEREFFILAAREQARSESSVFDHNSKAEAIALVKPNPVVAGNFPVTLQIQSTSTRRLLKNIRLNMLAGGAAGNATGDNGQNDLAARIAQTKSNLQDEKPEAEIECEVPQEPMERYFEACVRCFNGDEKKIKRSLAVAAIVGFVNRDLEPSAPRNVEESQYKGPLPLAAEELNARYEVLVNGGISRPPADYDMRDMYDCSEAQLLKGQWTKRIFGNEIITCYDISIDWHNGLPCKVRVKLDLSPNKDKILKRASAEE